MGRVGILEIMGGRSWDVCASELLPLPGGAWAGAVVRSDRRCDLLVVISPGANLKGPTVAAGAPAVRVPPGGLFLVEHDDERLTFRFRATPTLASVDRCGLCLDQISSRDLATVCPDCAAPSCASCRGSGQCLACGARIATGGSA